MSKFLFEGDYKRKPVQNLGGRSRHAETRDNTVRRAQLERQKRENERARASAVLVLQAAFRGMQERQKINLQLREEFHQNFSSQYTVDNIEHQMKRLNYFFKPNKDLQTLADLGKAMLLSKDKLIENVLTEDRSMLRLILILEKSLVGLLQHNNPARTTMLRLLETFTDWNLFERACVSANLNTAKTEEVMAIMWGYLVLHKDFFETYQNFLQLKFGGLRSNDTTMEQIQYDYRIFYARFFEAIWRLSATSRKFSVAKRVYVSKELVQVLLLKLAECIRKRTVITNEWPEIPAFIMYTGTQIPLTELHDAKLWHDHWQEVISRLIKKLIVKDNDVETSIRLRPLLYMFLATFPSDTYGIQRLPEFFQILNALLVCVDNRKQLFKLIEDDDYDEDDGLEDSDMKSIEEIEASVTFFKDSQVIYWKLHKLNQLDLIRWVQEFSFPVWQALHPFISALTQMESKRVPLHFPFIPAIYNNSKFMRSLCIHVLKREGDYKNELTVICWLLNLLMNILHDGEFLTGLSLNTDELLDFIHLLQDCYTDIILSDKDVGNPVETYFKKSLAHTLMQIHDRNTRLKLYPEDVFVSSKFTVVFPMETHNIKFRDFIKPQQESLTLLDQRLLRVLLDFPFALSFHDRVSIWHQILQSDHIERQIMDNPLDRQHIQIRRTYIYEDAYEKLSPQNVFDLRADIRISLVNVVGVEEAGVDGGGLLREFLTEATKAGVDPNRGLFRVDSENRIYPSPVAKKIFPDFNKHFFFMGRLVGKALYRSILLELPLAAFFMQLCAFGSVSSAVDYLATLDPDLHKNLLKLRNFNGDWAEIGLDFTIASDELGEATVIELKKDGKNIAVDKDNVIEYIHLVADYKINREIVQECAAFRNGLLDVVPILRIFSWKEMQTLISGSDKPINVEDWKANTNYAGGYAANHRTITMFWQVVENFDEEHLRKLLKFVTSCSRPPLLGFRDLLPKFGISNAGVSDRLPTAATCMNLLKLPEFNDIETLRERLVYAITAQAGFELS